MTLSSASPGFGSIYGTYLAVLLRSRGIDTIILGGINTNASADTTAREAAVHEFRDSGRAARGACRRPGTGMARPPV